MKRLKKLKKVLACCAISGATGVAAIEIGQFINRHKKRREYQWRV